MKPHLLLFSILTVLCACTDQNQNRYSLPFPEFADSLFQANVEGSFIAGATIVVVQNDTVVLDKAYGYSSLEPSVPMTKEESFEIGSVTKQFIAAGILRLAAEGKLSLEDDFTKYLEFDTRGRTVTIGHLLNHTSGIIDYTAISKFWEIATHPYVEDSVVGFVEEEDFLFEPGEALIYSSSAYHFLGLIIENLSGMEYSDYLKEQFFEPLGMDNTYPCSKTMVANKAYSYQHKAGKLEKHPNYVYTWPSLCSTSQDLFIWMSALHNGEIFDQSTYELMTQPGVLNDGTRVRYTMGLDHFSNFGHQLIGHLGGTNGYLSDTRYFPNEDLYIICLVNTGGPAGALFFTDEITWRLLEKKKFKNVPLDVDLEAVSGKYTGQGRGGPASMEIAVSGNSLVFTRGGRKHPESCFYMGNNTWYDGIRTYQINGDECRLDNVSGHYILKKQ